MIEHFFGLLMTQTWQITALAIIVAFVVKLAAKNRPHLAHALWVLVLIKCVTPPLWGHSLGVFSQLQVRLMPAPEQGQLHRYASEALYSMADTESPADASLMGDGGTDMEQGQSQSLSIDEGTVPTLDAQEAGIAYAVPVLPAESVASDATWLRPGGLLLSGLAAGAILTLCLLVFRYLRCLREIHRHRTMEFDEPLRERVQHLTRQLRVRRIPQIIVSDVLFGPAVLGLLRHTIVLPRCLFEKMELFVFSAVPSPPSAGEKVADRPDEGADRESSTFNDPLSFLDPILAHELLHIRRGDLRMGTLQAIVQSLWWFHPAVWLSNRWLSREAERCCDEQVIAELRCSPAQYARSLLSVIECKHQLQPIPVFPGMKPVEITTQRMERIMSLRNGLKKRTPTWCWVVIVVLGFIVLPGAIAQRSSNESLSSPAAASSGLTITNDGETEAVLVVLEAGLATEQEIARTASNDDPGLVGTVRFDQPSNVADRPGRSPATSETQDNVAGRYDGPPTPKGIGRVPKLDSPDKLLVPERAMPPEIQQSSDPLLKLVWEARESSRRRLLKTDEHTPWQLMHGLLGLRQDFLVNHNGRIINGLEWIQSGPTFKDEPPFQENQPWFQKTKYGGQAHPYLRPYLFEGHINQFAAILASCRLPLNAQFGTPDGPITMQDLITNAQMTVNDTEEVSWTLSTLSQYLPPDARWVNANGEEWSIEGLVKLEVGKTIDGPCGGTCGLFALAIAGNEYQRSGKPLEGVWLEAEEKIQKHIALARNQQNSDGTLSSNYFRGLEYKQEFDKRLASSGALLQFLMMAASDQQLKDDWLRRAVEATANDLKTNRKAFVSCEPLFTTTNALSIYLDRVLLFDQIASRMSPVGSNLAGPKPQSEVEKPEDSVPTMVAIYPVADLVVSIRNVDAEVAGPVDAGRAADSATAVVPSPASGRTSDDRWHAPGGAEELLNTKADFAPLTELIKATVQPNSWGNGLAIQVEEKTLSLIIRQSEKAHEEIQKLLSQLRDAQDQSVQIPCLVMHLTTESQSKWLEEQCSLHPLQHGSGWALLPPQRCESFTQALLEQKPEVLSRPVVRTISGQIATITVGALAAGGAATATTGIRLEVTPHVLPYSNVIRLQHSFSIGEFTNDMPQPIESLVGSGQTLLLLVDDPAEKEKPDAARSPYLLMMTPEYIPQKEEDEAASGATPENSADAVD